MITVVLSAIVTLHVFDALAAISVVGKERKPITPGTAVVTTAIQMFVVAALVWVLVNL